MFVMLCFVGGLWITCLGDLVCWFFDLSSVWYWHNYLVFGLVCCLIVDFLFTCWVVWVVWLVYFVVWLLVCCMFRLFALDWSVSILLGCCIFDLLGWFGFADLSFLLGLLLWFACGLVCLHLGLLECRLFFCVDWCLWLFTLFTYFGVSNFGRLRWAALLGLGLTLFSWVFGFGFDLIVVRSSSFYFLFTISCLDLQVGWCLRCFVVFVWVALLWLLCSFVSGWFTCCLFCECLVAVFWIWVLGCGFGCEFGLCLLLMLWLLVFNSCIVVSVYGVIGLLFVWCVVVY